MSVGQSKRSDALFAEGVSLYEQGDYRKAIRIFEKMSQLDAKELPEGSERGEYGSMWIGRCYYLLGDSITAQKYLPYKYMYEPVDRRRTVASDAESEKGLECMRRGDYAGAQMHAENCLKLEQEALGENNLFSVNSLIALGNIYRLRDMTALSILSYDKAMEMLRCLGIGKSVFMFQAYTGKVYTYLSVDNIESARKELDKLEEIYNCASPSADDKYVLAVIDLFKARIYTQTKEFDLAKEYAIRAYEGTLEQYSADDEEKFSTLMDCISCLGMVNGYAEGSELIKRSLPKVSENRGHKGCLMSYLANYSQDLEIYQQSLDLLSGTQYVDDYNFTKCLMADLLWIGGKTREAIGMYGEVIDYYSANDTTNNCYSKALMSMGTVMAIIGNYSRSHECYTKILDLLRDDKNNPEYALTFMRWLPVYSKYIRTLPPEEFKDYYNRGFALGAELKEILANVNYNDFLNYGIGIETITDVVLNFIQAIAADATTTQSFNWGQLEGMISNLVYEFLIPKLGDNSMLTIRGKALLAHLRYVTGRNEDAVRLTQEAVESCKATGLPYDNYLHDLGYYLYDGGDPAGAYEYFEIGYNFNKSRILTGYRWMSQKERESITDAYRGNLDNIPHYAAATPEDGRYAELGYNALLLTKGLLLNSTIEFSRLLTEKGDKEALKLLEQWQTTSQRYQMALDKGDIVESERLKREADEKEKKLIDISKKYGDYTDALTVEYQDVQKGLGDKDVAIEFFSYQHDAKSRMICALVLTKDQKPRLINVGKDSDLRKYEDSAYLSAEMFNALFCNMMQILPVKGEGNIYFAADGMLHSLAIENLYGAKNYSFRRVSSTREIAKAMDKVREEGRIEDIYLYGGIYYGLGELEVLYNGGKRGSREADDVLAALPGTFDEVKSIDALLSARTRSNVYTGRQATEESFKRLSGCKSGLIHVATHGFFQQPVQDSEMSMSDAAMRSSGLYFAGAQNTLDGSPHKGQRDDGVLYADEISTLDLHGVRLAVLSACETGRGVVSAEGVFGLQRGFKQAGATSILMSLWKVDDSATQYLMQDFYRNLAECGDAYKALSKARMNTRKIYPNPEDWAAFVIIDALNKIRI